MAESPSFTKFVPGFEFLQGLVKNAGAALPSIGQWIAPTLNPEELQKRIDELRTVQFWLEQNARMLGATIQALEVQRMTLSTLQTMNVQVDDLTESLKIKMPPPQAEPPDLAAAAQVAKPPARKTASQSTDEATALPSSAQPVVDPMQWWGALTNQFAQLATSAMKDTGAADAAKNLASAMVKQSFDAANQTFKAATGGGKPKAAAKPSGTAAKPASRTAPRKRSAP